MSAYADQQSPPVQDPSRGAIHDWLARFSNIPQLGARGTKEKTTHLKGKDQAEFETIHASTVVMMPFAEKRDNGVGRDDPDADNDLPEVAIGTSQLRIASSMP